jgi:hypothetical protein
MIGCAVIVGMVVNGYPTTCAAPQFHIGAYLMYAAVGARILSHPMVTKVFLKLFSTLLRIFFGPQNNRPQTLPRIDTI